MKRLLPLLCAVLLLPSCKSDRYVTFTGYAQGGTYFVKMNLRKGDGHLCRTDRNVIYGEIEKILKGIDDNFSGYNGKSVLSRFNDGESVNSDKDFSELYARSREIWEMTDGAVDVACGPLFDIWGFGFKDGEYPSDEEVMNVKRECGLSRMKPVMPVGTVTSEELLSVEGGALPRLNYNAVAQGYSCDLVARYLYSLGIHDMLISIGGEIFCDGKSPSGGDWKIGIDKPFDGNMVPGEHLQSTFPVSTVPCGVVTSGNYRKYYVKDGRKYSHTIDPRTGYPVSHSLLCATVIASDATLADGLATYCMVVGLEEAEKFVCGMDGVEACLIYDEDGTMKMWTSSGFPAEQSGQ